MCVVASAKRRNSSTTINEICTRRDENSLTTCFKLLYRKVRMAITVTVDQDTQQYVFTADHGITVQGFTSLYEQSLELTRRLGLPADTVIKQGSMEAYQQNRKLIERYAAAGLSRTTFYHYRTSPEVRRVIDELLRGSIARKVRVWIGDVGTGVPWLEEHDVLGWFGRSLGPLRVPLLISSRGDGGGVAVLDHCILRIARVTSQSAQVLYQAANWQMPVLKVLPRPKEADAEREQTLRKYKFSVYDQADKLIARFTSLKYANEYVAFQQGTMTTRPTYGKKKGADDEA